MINGVDSGFRVDSGVYSAPKQPRSPYPPRYFREARSMARLRNTALAGITGQGDMDETAGRDTRGRDGDTQEARGYQAGAAGLVHGPALPAPGAAAAAGGRTRRKGGSEVLHRQPSPRLQLGLNAPA